MSFSREATCAELDVGFVALRCVAFQWVGAFGMVLFRTMLRGMTVPPATSCVRYVEGPERHIEGRRERILSSTPTHTNATRESISIHAQHINRFFGDRRLDFEGED
jgi:hypothetical protein